MFAGVSGGALFAGGGSRFLGKPPWEGGQKDFSDKVFILESLKGPWRELGARLPAPLAHSACTPYGEEVICAGGVNDSGPLREVWRIGLQGDALSSRALSPLPHPLVNGAAAIVQDVLYVVGGVMDAASTQTLKMCWSLSLLSEGAEWVPLPDLPGETGSVMTAGGDDRYLYVFGGMSFLPDAEGICRPRPSNQAFRYDPALFAWTPLKSMPVARAGAASAVQLPNGCFLVAGGYGVVFPGPPEEHPGFERETLLYSPEGDCWGAGPSLPADRRINRRLLTSFGAEPMVCVPAVIWNGHFVLVSGEVCPATRTPAVIGLSLCSCGVGGKARYFGK